jgi:hypothetical protein
MVDKGFAENSSPEALERHWLVDGKRHYGDGLYKEAERITGIDKSRLMTLKSISDRFEILLRNKNLTWNHHYEVASIETLEYDAKGKLGYSCLPNMVEEIAEAVGMTHQAISTVLQANESFRFVAKPGAFSEIENESRSNGNGKTTSNQAMVGVRGSRDRSSPLILCGFF